jgi:hypothetical protein
MQSSGYHIITHAPLLFWSAIGAFVSVLDFHLKYLSIHPSVMTVVPYHICINLLDMQGQKL